MTHDTRSRSLCFNGGREEKNNTESVDKLLLRQRSRDAHGCHMKHTSMPRSFFLCDLRERLLPHVFTAGLLLPSVLLPYKLFFLLLISGIVSADLIRSVVQICFCLYFNWPHHKKNYESE